MPVIASGGAGEARHVAEALRWPRRRCSRRFSTKNPASARVETFNGGDAEIGIHGNNDASVLGSNVTHGCVRMDNDAITMLSRQLPLGTPVDIVA